MTKSLFLNHLDNELRVESWRDGEQELSLYLSIGYDDDALSIRNKEIR